MDDHFHYAMPNDPDQDLDSCDICNEDDADLPETILDDLPKRKIREQDILRPFVVFV